MIREKIHSGRGLQIVLIVIWGLCCFLFFQLKYTYHFYYEEQEGLFLMDWEYVLGYFSGDGCLSRLVGDFLTQFYHYLYLGALILTGVLLVVGDMARRALESILNFYFESREKTVSWVAFVFGIVMMTIGAFCALGYDYRLESLIRIAGLFGLVWLVFAIPAPSNWGRMRHLYAIAATLVMIFAFGLLSDKDFKVTRPEFAFEKVLAFDNEYYFGNYGKVIQMAQENEGQLTEEMTFFYCMALERQGMLADMLPSMKSPNLGTFYKIKEDTPHFTIRMINELYYLIGDMTYTERAAQLANTFSREGRSVRMIKRMAEVNLVNNDIPAAMKYLRLLEKTIAYKKWAREHMPESMSDRVRAEIQEKQKFVNTSDNIRIGDDCYTILTQLLDSNRKNTVALDYLLLSDMLAGQKDVFVKDYEKYGPSENVTLSSIYNGAKQTNE